MVVLVGLAIGEQLFASDRPKAGAHEQLTPPEPMSGCAWPGLMNADPFAAAVTVGHAMHELVVDSQMGVAGLNAEQNKLDVQ